MEDYKLWFNKAKDDLNWAEENIKSQVFYGACFAAQQAAEKALKSFLLKNSTELRKIHDIVALLEDCSKIDNDFEKLRLSCETLFPYYVETRYPLGDDLVSFNEQKAQEALKAASEVINFVKNKI